MGIRPSTLDGAKNIKLGPPPIKCTNDAVFAGSGGRVPPERNKETPMTTTRIDTGKA